MFAVSLLCRRNLGYEDVLADLAKKGIAIRVASPKLVMEEVGVSSGWVLDLSVLSRLFLKGMEPFLLRKEHSLWL